jgi:hypothetical protein
VHAAVPNMIWRECFGGPMDGQRLPDLGRPFDWAYPRPTLINAGRYEADEMRLRTGRVKAIWRWIAASEQRHR